MVKEFILNYLQKEYEFPENVDVLTLNYVESGYVDSMGLLKFIAELEAEFEIEFTDDELEKQEFKVIGLLIDMVERKIKTADGNK